MTEKLTYESPATSVVELECRVPVLDQISAGINPVTWEGYDGEDEIS